MKIAECGTILSDGLTDTRPSCRDESAYGKTGEEILVMARAYADDGKIFLSSGDPVNGLAAYLYGLGWLHFGCAAGLLVHGRIISRAACPFRDPFEAISPGQREKLTEKTARYSRMLRTALSSVAVAAEEGTVPAALAERVRSIAGLYLTRGDTCMAAGRYEDALAAFSYGHGWLDAGVRTGLFSISGSRAVFAI